MDETSLNGEAAVESGGSAAVGDSGGARQLNRSHPFRGCLPIKGSLVQYVSFLRHFQVCHLQILWPFFLEI